MNKLFKYVLLVSSILAVFLDLLLTFVCSAPGGFNCGGSFNALLSPLVYPPYVVTYFFGGSILGISGNLTDLSTNVVFLVLDFLYLFVILFFIGTVVLVIKKLFKIGLSVDRNLEIQETIDSSSGLVKSWKFWIITILIIIIILYIANLIGLV